MLAYGPEDYRRVRQRGAHGSNADLHDTPSGRGREGHAFPTRVRDHQLGTLMVGPRPGEHSVPQQRELIGQVARGVTASVLALRARVFDKRPQIAEVHWRSADSQIRRGRSSARAGACSEASESRRARCAACDRSTREYRRAPRLPSRVGDIRAQINAARADFHGPQRRWRPSVLTSACRARRTPGPRRGPDVSAIPSGLKSARGSPSRHRRTSWSR